jgi:hypothetical protein
MLRKADSLIETPVSLPKTRFLLGLTVWAIAWLAGRFPLEVAILLFAPLVIVSLARGLIPLSMGNSRREKALARLIAWLEFPAALCVVASFFVVDQGTIAGLLTLPWFGVTLLCAVQGVLRFLAYPRRWLDEFGYCGGRMLLAVGGFWIMATRFGWRPGGFSDIIVLLSGVHFHYAAFALPVLASRVVENAPRWLGRGTVICVTGGVPLVGIGINSLPLVEIAAVLLLVAACLVLAGLLVRFGMGRDPRTLLLSLVAGISLITGMALAGIFGCAEYLEATWISIPAMVATHGAVNAFGFTLCGLLAVYRANGQPTSDG